MGEALAELNADREFLTRGNVFTDDMLDAYIKVKQAEVDKVNQTTHPIEYDLYYSC